MTAAIAPVAVGGPAYAQTNSRLCGKTFTVLDRTSPDLPVLETAFLIYEVVKNDRALVCGSAVGTIKSTPEDAPDEFKKLFEVKDMSRWEMTEADFRVKGIPRDFVQIKCEDFMVDPKFLNKGSLNFIGDNWPATRNTTDICENMNRSDTSFELEVYWLHGGKNGGWDFIRG